ncbi:MAG: hypothetical protein ABIH00_06460 [Armatimonadota bacterium]
MKKTIIIMTAIILSVCMMYAAYSDELLTKTINCGDDFYTFTFDNDLKTLQYSLNGFYAYKTNTLIGTNVSKYWAAAGPEGAVLVYKVEPNSFPYVLIDHKTGNIVKTGYLYVDKYDVKDVKVIPTQTGAKITVYYVTGGDKSFELNF